MSDDGPHAGEARPPGALRSHRFTVEVPGRPSFGVTAVDGLAMSTADRSGHAADRTDRRWWWPDGLLKRALGRRRAPRSTTSPPLELRRSVGEEPALWNWLKDRVDGRFEPRDVSIYLVDEAADPVLGWTCHGARPVEWRGPDLRADESGVPMETLELAHDGITATTDPSPE